MVTSPVVTLLRYTPAPEELCGYAAATCYRGKSPERSLKIALGNNHESVIEHASFTFLLQDVSRALLAQITRHRLSSFSVESQRYVGYDGGFEWVIPPSIINLGEDAVERYRHQMDKIQNWYNEWAGRIPHEDARMILPNACTTKIIVTMNCRELKHFFSLRCCNRAMWQIRSVADAMLQACRQVAPEIFKNAGPGCVRGHCPEDKPCGHPRIDLMEGKHE